MKEKSRKMALCGVLCALSTVCMLLGGVIPFATFCCPALAAAMLTPLLLETGDKMTLAAYAAVAALSLVLCPDKEAALIFAFLGYYPVLKPRIDRLRRKPLRVAAKLALFNLAAAAMLALMAFVLNMQAVMAEYAEMTKAALIAFAVLCNITMLLYDRLLAVFAFLYQKKLRPKLFGANHSQPKGTIE